MPFAGLPIGDELRSDTGVARECARAVFAWAREGRGNQTEAADICWASPLTSPAAIDFASRPGSVRRACT